MAGTLLRIGIVAPTPLQQHVLRALVADSGHRVAAVAQIAQVVNGEPGGDNTAPADIDGWLINLDGLDEDDNADVDPLDTWLDGLTVPAIFCEGPPPQAKPDDYHAWSRRLRGKLDQLAGTITLAQAGDDAARQVWVLAASTGGPAAVKQFLSELPANLDIGFVYVQHIDAGFDETLSQVISRNTHYAAKLVEHGDLIRMNGVAIVSPNRTTEVLSNGTFLVKDEPWKAPYQPSVDSIVANVAYHYGSRAGVIIFTGMGDDGAASARIMKQKGGQVWVQTPETCTVDSMPQATMAAGEVDFSGSPQMLAQQLVATVQNNRRAQPPTASATR